MTGISLKPPVFLHGVLRLFALVGDMCYNTQTFSSNTKKAPGEWTSPEAHCLPTLAAGTI
jgi:hypothetical protein